MAGYAPLFYNLRGADLRGNTDVHVSAGTSLPDNKAARQSMIMERFQAGLYGDPADPSTAQTVRRMMEDVVEVDEFGDR